MQVSWTMPVIEADHLIVGAGAAGMAFADALIGGGVGVGLGEKASSKSTG